MLLGMSWRGWLNFCILQWFGLRLHYTTTDDGRYVIGAGYGWDWPCANWYWTLRREVVLPLLISLPALALYTLLVWRLHL
jgi:hypothetical protein